MQRVILSIYLLCIISILTHGSFAQGYATITGDKISSWTSERVSISMSLSNNIAISAFQLDITLPEGFSLSSNEKESIVLSSERIQDDQIFFFGSTPKSTATYRIAATCHYGSSFSSNQGTIAKIIVLPSKTVAAGEYKILLSRIIASDMNGNAIVLPNAEIPVSISTFLLGDANDDKVVNISDVTTIINYLTNPTAAQTIHQNAADVNQDGYVSQADISIIINQMLDVSTEIK